ncbi:MAG: 4Fe-4S binding protein [Christensenellaceae bacterium]|jgi:dihydroorotate dehydrogenase (fumarate)|nr:4Fe-4S binding protein [Christensenellaceae bacterium]
MDLSVDIAGIKLKSPIISSSSIDGMDGERIGLVSEFNLGAATTKTIVKDMQTDVLPNMKMVRGGSMINCVFGTNLTADQWFNEEFPKARKAGIPIIANMAGTTPEEAVELARGCEAAGASFIEYPTACPHMGNILEAMYPGLKMPLPEVNDPREYARQIEAVKKAVKIPVIAKFSAIFHLNCKTWARAVVDAGADAISAADSIGPVIGINIEDGQPILGGPKGYGGLTGAALKPLVLRMVLEITEEVDVPVIGIGGVASGEDAAEYIMAGASAVALSSSSIRNGYEVYADVYDGLAAFMKRKGYNSLADFRGLTHTRIRERAEQGKQILREYVYPQRNKNRCTACGNCVMACAYGAIEMGESKPEFITEKCHGCGMCASVCSTQSIDHNYYPV